MPYMIRSIISKTVEVCSTVICSRRSTLHLSGSIFSFRMGRDPVSAPGLVWRSFTDTSGDLDQVRPVKNVEMDIGVGKKDEGNWRWEGAVKSTAVEEDDRLRIAR